MVVTRQPLMHNELAAVMRSQWTRTWHRNGKNSSMLPVCTAVILSNGQACLMKPSPYSKELNLRNANTYRNILRGPHSLKNV